MRRVSGASGRCCRGTVWDCALIRKKRPLPRRHERGMPQRWLLGACTAVHARAQNQPAKRRLSQSCLRHTCWCRPPACRCTSPPPPPPARRDAGPGSAAAPSMTLTPLASAASLSDGHEAQPFPASALEAGAGEVALAVDGHRALCSIGAAGLRWAYDISRCCVPGVRSESGERPQLRGCIAGRESTAARALFAAWATLWASRLPSPCLAKHAPVTASAAAAAPPCSAVRGGSGCGAAAASDRHGLGSAAHQGPVGPCAAVGLCAAVLCWHVASSKGGHTTHTCRAQLNAQARAQRPAPPLQMHRLAVYTFRRAPNNPNSWHPRQIVLETPREVRTSALLERPPASPAAQLHSWRAAAHAIRCARWL